MNTNYPNYITYTSIDRCPTVLDQEFHIPSLDIGEVYYPRNKYLTSFFSTETEEQMFGASQFCSFLSDTIEVEHCLVIPAIVSLRRIPYRIPDIPMQDLFKIATDEAYHAEQSNLYLTKLENHFGLPNNSKYYIPIFLSKLDNLYNQEQDLFYKNLIKIIHGIVTETRISVELSKFAKNENLSISVRNICESHSLDEIIHAAQFQALGIWLWEKFDEKIKLKISEIYIKSLIARSIPDIHSIVNSFRHVTGRTINESYKIVLSKYDTDILFEEMLVAAKPTIKYINRLGVNNYISFSEQLNNEKLLLSIYLEKLIKSIC